MPQRKMILGSVVLVAAMLAAAVATGFATSSALLPMHWGLAGNPDRVGPKWEALLAMPLAAIVVTAIFAFLPMVEPAREGLRRSGGLVRSVWLGTLLVLAAAEGATIAAARHWPISAPTMILGALGLCLLVTGNQLGKSRRMYLVGVRTPWTLADEDIWIATHRVAGRLMVLAGIVSLSLAVAGASDRIAAPLLGGAIAAAVVVPVGYSWLLWERKRRPRSA